MLKVGITGGIGSGKTTVCKIFQNLGTSVFYADIVAKRLMNEDEGLKSVLMELFGSEIYNNGVLQRRKLAELIFNNKQSLEKINSVVHPAVQREFVSWADNHKHEKYVIYEAAIIYEAGLDRALDKVITVYAPDYLKIKRIMQRDKVSKEEVLQRMKNQMDDNRKRDIADHVIDNDENSLVIPQVLALHKIFNKG